MLISILTLFPQMFKGPFGVSIVKRALDKQIIDIDIINIRDFASDTYKSVDDHPYGGGAGMILRVDVIDKALESVKCKVKSPPAGPLRLSEASEAGEKCKKILLDPTGVQYTQAKANQYSKLDHLIVICGHYEGVDARVRSLVDEEISIGDYVLTGGEIPAMVIVDSIVRLLPGVLKKAQATLSESFSSDAQRPTPNAQLLLEYPQYTKPQTYKGVSVPGILLSGDHTKIALWREMQSHKKTKKNRPDFLKSAKT